MATKILKKLPPLEGVVAGEKATLDLPIGPTYYKLQLVGIIKPASGQIAKIEDIFGLIQVQVNGKSQREFTALELDALNKLNGAQFAYTAENITDPGTAAAADDTMKFTIDIYFAEEFRKSYLAAKAMAWPTRWPDGSTLGTFQVHITIPAAAGKTLHAISAYASIDNSMGQLDANGNPIFNISKWWRTTVLYTASGERHLVNLPKRDMYQSLHFFCQTADPISHIKIKRDTEEILDVSKTINDLDLIDHDINEFALSASRLDVIFDRDDLPDSALPMNGVREWEVIPTLASAAAANKAITLITQVYGPRD